MKYKILICGVGSIGERHLKNLLLMGYNDIILYRKNNLPDNLIFLSASFKGVKGKAKRIKDEMKRLKDIKLGQTGCNNSHCNFITRRVGKGCPPN